MLTSGRRSASFFASVLIGALPLAGCDDGPPARPIVPTDMSVADFGTDAGLDAGFDGGPDAGPDAGDGGVTLTGCTPSSPVDLFVTAYVPGGKVPFGAAANVDGLMVAASVQTSDHYPFFERIGVFFGSTGGVSSPVSLQMSPELSATNVDVSRGTGTGFVALWDDQSGTLSSTDLWIRTVDGTGTPQGADAVALTNTASSERNGRILRTTSGYAAAWTDMASGLVTGVLDANATLTGSAAASATLGTVGVYALGAIAGAPHLAYLGSDSMVHGVAITSSGAVAGAPATWGATTAGSGIAVADSATGAAIAYEGVLAGARRSIQFRYVNPNGTATVLERVLTPLDAQGYEPSIAALAGGNLVVYRHDPDAGSTTLRLVVTGTFGDTITTMDLVDVFPDAGRFMVRVSPDGEAYVVYHVPTSVPIDGGASSVEGATVRAIRMVCQ